MNCETRFVKYVLFFFNILFSVCGILLIVLGALLLKNMGNYNNLEEAVKAQQIPVGLIAIGSVVLIISFFGCCGAIGESYCMSMTYSLSLLVLLIVQIAAIVYFWLDKQNIINSMEKIVDKAWDERETGFMDVIQVGLKCCGKNGPVDYLTSVPPPVPPISCCKNFQCTSLANLYLSGCKSKIVEVFSGSTGKFVGLVVLGIELVGFMFAFCLANNFYVNKRHGRPLYPSRIIRTYG